MIITKYVVQKLNFQSFPMAYQIDNEAKRKEIIRCPDSSKYSIGTTSLHKNFSFCGRMDICLTLDTYECGQEFE